jgi:hypothetical protein
LNKRCQTANHSITLNKRFQGFFTKLRPRRGNITIISHAEGYAPDVY